MVRQYIKSEQIIIHDLNSPLLKRKKMRDVCGPYIFTPCNASDGERFFYLDSDLMPELRWQWCDDVLSNIRHDGWYCDDTQSQTIRGVVFRLNHNHGFLAGWSMGESMASVLDTYIHNDETSAAYVADSMAENAAEREQQSQLENES